MMNKEKIKFVFFGSPGLSRYILEELEKTGLIPMLHVTDAKADLPIEKLRELQADVFVVAFFGKILPAELIYMPPYKTLNVHPSLLPKLRGPAPIQDMIIQEEEPGVTIIRMDEKMDHGPILAQTKLKIEPWPDHYRVVEEKIDREGGKMLGELLPKWVRGEIEEKPQNDALATYTNKLSKEAGLLDLSDDAEKNLRKVLAYSRWPGAYFFHRRNDNKEIRVVVKDAEIKEGEFIPTRVVPEGKKEMNWQDFLRGNS